MEHSEHDSKLHVADGAANGASRDMSAWTVDQNMQPTPRQPHLAHCCACNEKEIAASMDRQRVSEQGGMEREIVQRDSGEFRNLVAWAGEIVTRNSPGSPCLEEAGDFLSALFKKATAAINGPAPAASSLTMPKF